MKKRVIWKMFALTIITLGIYRLYWFIKTRKELMKLNPKIKSMSPMFIVIPVLLIVAAFGFFIFSAIQSTSSIPNYCNNFSSSSQQFTQSTAAECQTDVSILPILLFYLAIFLIFPMVVIWLWSYSKGVEKATKEKTSFALAMIVLLLVPDGIDILIIQDAFNKLSSKTA